MKKRPFLLASVLLAGCFVFFLALAVTVASFVGQPTNLVIGDKIGIVEIYGVIADSKQVIEQLHDFRDNDSIKALVLRIDSPGGGVGPSQEIYDEVLALDTLKPIVVSMGSVAASGGYYVAAAAREIVANPGTITGSIGVIMEFANFQELLEKIGLSSVVVKSGAYKDIGSPTREMSIAEKEILQDLIDDVHSQFVSSVAEGRELDEQAVRSIADGRIFSGRKAMQLGLVDRMGNLQVAIDRAADLAGLEADPKVVYPPGKKPRFIDLFIEETLNRLHYALQKQRSVGLQYLWPGFD
ncbi:MAG: signal peptide peptidase SppA [Deltaproteobacteria bacterium]|jgi:protease-4|nr:signal peptide peptidase SppA [Deltaproteobacteria bacterium]MBW2512439.1 signal peptide peptidase SppA [Deltaproteobacteria bacterium]MDH4006786.1 signal peptide peptidase SppA [Desulfuromonadales bacterium]